ncbi:DUF805 domain-containing protein [Massilia sp. TWP1-3-3]|uniref:DUF805 domain-containing protein n=1 Tax=Massilia sp. TWP1-3-3 TaxID=2804573 RepID=UPI003CE77841
MNNPYNAPAADMSVQGNNVDTYQPQVFAMKGRIGRVRYIAYSVGVSMAIYFAAAIFGGILMALTGGKQGALIALGFLVIIPLIAVSFIMAIRRVNDMGQSGWMSLIIVVPLLNLWLLFAPGTPGTNEYGPAPVKNSTGVILAAFSPFLFAVVIGILAAIAIPAYQAYTNKARAALEQSAAPAETQAVPE